MSDIIQEKPEREGKQREREEKGNENFFFFFSLPQINISKRENTKKVSGKRLQIVCGERERRYREGGEREQVSYADLMTTSNINSVRLRACSD